VKNGATWTVYVKTPMGRVVRCKRGDDSLVECCREEAESLARTWNGSTSRNTFGGGNQYFAEPLDGPVDDEELS
jgi:hypothetical protein